MSADREKTMTITEFLEARIAEQEAAVEVAREYVRSFGGSPLRPAIQISDDDGHILWSTEHLLAECAAKRAIATSHGPDESPWDEEYCRTCADWDGCVMGEGPPNIPFPCDTLKSLAAVYSDHPGYQQEWAA